MSFTSWLLGILFFCLIGGFLGRRRALREGAQALGQLPQTEREQLLATNADGGLRNALEGLLRDDEALSDRASVARFHFAPGTRRDERWRAVRSLLVTLGSGSIIVVSGAVNPILNSMCFVLGGATLLRCVLSFRQFRRMRRWIEVSPFNLTEINERGARRVLRWGQPLVLRDRPWRRCIQVGSVKSGERICIHYELLEFQRAVQLVIQYGRFTSAESTGENVQESNSR